jgi:hypothetical protein
MSEELLFLLGFITCMSHVIASKVPYTTPHSWDVVFVTPEAEEDGEWLHVTLEGGRVVVGA